MPKNDNINLDEIANITHGFVGADLAALSRESAMKSIRRVLPDIDLKQDKIPTDILTKIKVKRNDFLEAFKEIEPSALREALIEVPNVKWKDIGGLKDVRQELIEAVEWPLKYPQSFKDIGADPPRGILLYGPPGTGKTLLAKAVASESEANFISVKGPEILSKWVGESEKAIREIFKKAKESAPTIIFFDEIDAIAPRRGGSCGDSKVTERIVNQILTEMDGIEKLEDVIIIGATNRPDMLDEGLLRPGRFDRLIKIKNPEKEGRYEIFKVHTKKMKLDDDIDLKKLAEDTDKLTGADIQSICQEAAMLALREDIGAKKISNKHFSDALSKIKKKTKTSNIDTSNATMVYT